MPPSPDSNDRPLLDGLSAETIHDLRAPLTVIKAQAQMLGRWLRRTDVQDAEAALTRLAAIDAMVARLILELDALRVIETPDGQIDDPERP